MTDSGIVVIGAGLAGVAAANALSASGIGATIYEARPFWGGHTHSDVVDGFTFDEGPHISFTKDPRVIEVFERGAGEVREFRARLSNYYRGSWVPHPAQVHLHGLDPDLVARSIVDLANAREHPRDVRNYEDWCYNTFGRTFADHFPLVYTRKYWTVEARDLTTDWIEKRVYSPSLEEVVKGALKPRMEGDFHYFSVVRYPMSGGYQSFMRALVDERTIRLEKEVRALDLAARRVVFADGTDVYFDRLVSTMPLPDLVKAIPPEQVPADIQEAAAGLMWTSLILVDVAVDRRDLFPDHVFYVYDEDVSFARAHFPHMLAPTNAPDGKGSIQCEIYYSRRRPLPSSPSTLPERVVAELIKIGVLRDRHEVLWARHRAIEYANVVFDGRRADALAAVVPWLADRGVIVAGRYGEWGYHWTDDAVRSGWTAADRALRAAV